jgi:OmpA-OmpF porin, OOP family
MTIRISQLWAVFLAFAALGSATMAQAADDTFAWYAGAGVGRSDVTRPNSWASQNDAALLTRGTTSSTLIDSHDTAWKLFGGYQFNEFIAVEAGYQDLGRFKGTSTVTVPAPASTASGSWDAAAASVAAVATYPLANRFGVLFKAGLAVTRRNVNVSAPAQNSLNETRVQPLLGVGVKFDATKTIGIRGEFERFNNVGDGSTTGQSPLNVWSVSALYRF